MTHPAPQFQIQIISSTPLVYQNMDECPICNQNSSASIPMASKIMNLYTSTLSSISQLMTIIYNQFMISRLRAFGLTRMFISIPKGMKDPAMDYEMESEEYEVQDQIVKKQIDPAKVIKKFRREVLTKTLFSKQQEEMTKLIQDYDKQLKESLAKGTKDQQLTNARKLVEKFTNDKLIFGEFAKDPLISNYANYSAYKSATVKQQKIPGQSWQGQRITKGMRFLRSLGPEYIQNQAVDKLMTQSYNNEITVEEYARNTQDALNQGNMYIQRAQSYPKPKLTLQDRQTTEDAPEYGEPSQRVQTSFSPVFNDDGELNVALFTGQNNFGRLSPVACEEIYRCYLDGWNVRDISQRFGILPRRTKFVIWAQATYYTQVLPKMGFKHFKEVMLTEIEYGKKYGFIDYGLDLQVIRSEREQVTSRITTWNNKMVDIRGQTDADRFRKREQAIRLMEDAHRTSANKSSKVLLGYFGKNNKMTQMRNWVIHRAKGSDYKHAKEKTFRNLFKKTGRQTYK